MRVNLPPALLAKLRAHRAPRPRVVDDVMRDNDAFLLDPGLGTCLYLTADGRVLIDGRAWDENDVLREATDDEATVAFVCGARRTGIDDLLDLIPSPAPGSRRCTRCNGDRWMDFGVDVHGKRGRIVCTDCRGRGWTK
jgi:hypothetical protein